MRFIRSVIVLVALELFIVLTLPDYVAGVALALLCGAAHADAYRPLGLLNFLVLQWFGVRLTRTYELDGYDGGAFLALAITDHGSDEQRQRMVQGWKLLRWVVPLTGWWSGYRWIARRP